MKIFFDTEFTGLHQNTKLISIGLVDENDRKFYAEFCDFSDGYENADDRDWIEENVILHLKFYEKQGKGFNNSSIDINKKIMNVFGNTKHICESLENWLQEYESVELWSDCLAYDFILFNQLWGHAFAVPKNIYYIPFDICTFFKIKGIDPDISREKFIEVDEVYEKHNALWDAKVIKECYKKLMKI